LGNLQNFKFRVLQSTKMNWAGGAARRGKPIMFYILVGNSEGKRMLGRPCRDGKIIWKMVVRK